MPPLTPPGACASMTALRHEIDALDRQIIALLAARAGYIDRAVELKPGEGLAARIPGRVEEVLSKVRSAAGACGLDPALAEDVWRRLIEWSIAREERGLGRNRGRRACGPW